MLCTDYEFLACARRSSINVILRGGCIRRLHFRRSLVFSFSPREETIEGGGVVYKNNDNNNKKKKKNEGALPRIPTDHAQVKVLDL